VAGIQWGMRIVTYPVRKWGDVTWMILPSPLVTLPLSAWYTSVTPAAPASEPLDEPSSSLPLLPLLVSLAR